MIKIPTQRPPLKKISDVVWEISQDYKKDEPKMQVPARIFATPKLLEQMDLAVFEQISNVACLPGIQKAAMAMPDAHWGYGFPVGGVAAFDTETGIISPGGIGYDINCLTEDAKVLTEFGCNKQIKDFETEFVLAGKNTIQEQVPLRLASLNPTTKKIEARPAIAFMRKPVSEVLEATTKLGFKLKATAEHPFLTISGMRELGTIEKNTKIAINPFIGADFEEPSGTTIIREESFTDAIASELKKRNLLPLKENNPKLPYLARILGYLLGDGIVYFSNKKGFVCAYGTKTDLEQMQKDFAALDFSAKIYARTRKHKITSQYGTKQFEATNYELHVSSRALAQLFIALGMPTGRKTSVKYSVPGWLMAAPKWIKRLFLAGFFGAELSRPAVHCKTGFNAPILSQNKNKEFVEDGRNFLIQIMQLLSEFDIGVTKISERKEFRNSFGETYRLRLEISAKESSLLNLWQKIGFEYNEKRKILANISTLFILHKQKLSKERIETARLIKEYKSKGLRLNEIKKLLSDAPANKRFFERHYYEHAGVRINLDCISFRDFCDEKIRELTDRGALFDEIANISKVKYDGQVYDFTVDETHNFIANGIIVSNCGMRLVRTNLTWDEVKPKIRLLVDTLFKLVPAGVGAHGFIRLTPQQHKEVMVDGVKWCVKNGYGWPEDIERTEDEGAIKSANPEKVSEKAMKRGAPELGTLGSGNHYLEVQVVKPENIYDKKLADKLGIFPNQVVVMVHCGSRGFGHQICTDYVSNFNPKMKDWGITVRDPELACAPFKSKEAQDYIAAMRCAANYGFANRQLIMHRIREGFSQVFGRDAEKLGLNLIYDVAHNIAKVEEHKVDGKKKELVMHRKGATRCFGPSRKETPRIYKETGQPVIVGGSMETGSFLCVGTDEADDISFGSTMHGSGRTMSRSAAKRTFRGQELQKKMLERGIYVHAVSMPELAEEAGNAYKDINEVVETMHLANASKKVCRLIPVGNVKG